MPCLGERVRTEPMKAQIVVPWMRQIMLSVVFSIVSGFLDEYSLRWAR